MRDERFSAAIARFGRLFELFERGGHELYLVGGCVRDLVMGHPPKDYDFATDATPDRTRELLRSGGLRVIPLGEAFGTIATVIEGEQYEITTYRVKESYTKGSRHPEVVFGDVLAEDLGRRDLTINAMALGRDGRVVDPFGGCEDLEAGVLRVPGGGVEKTREIFADDPLRLLRVGRFAARLGFWPDESTTQAARAAAPTILEVSRERWKMELDKLLVAPFVEAGLRWLYRVGVLGICLPELSRLDELSELFAHADLEAVPHGVLDESEASGERALTHLASLLVALPANDVPLRWAGLLHGVGLGATRGSGRAVGAPAVAAMLAEGVARRLRFSNEERECVEYLVGAQSFWSGVGFALDGSGRVSRPAVRRQLLASGGWWRRLQQLVEARASVAEALLGGDAQRSGRAELMARLSAIEARRVELESLGPLEPQLPAGLGRELGRALGLPPGPRLGLLMDWLRESILDEVLPSGAPAEVYIEAARELVSGSGG